MHSFLFILAAATSAMAQVVNPTCARDNCLRAVVASGQPPYAASASRDCSSFFRNTVTPATSTATSVVYTTVTAPAVLVTSTATTLSTVTTIVTTITSPEKREAAAKFDHRIEDTNNLAVRQQTVIPSKVPAYASACSGTARYSSACSCIGATKQTTTVAAPITTSVSTSTITVTPTIVSSVTVTQTTTVPATATATCTSFYLQAQGSSVNSQYAVLPGTSDETINSFTSDTSSAAIFTFDSAGHLIQGQYFANTDQFSPATIFFDPPGAFSNSPELTCTIPSAVGGPLSCTGYTSSATVFQLCPPGCQTGNEPCAGVALGSSVDSRCQAIAFNAVPAC